MPQFFINTNNIENNIITVNDKETYHHLTRSLRVKIGEKLKFIDEKEMTYLAQISAINSKELQAQIIKAEKSFRKLDFELTLACGVLNSDAQNFVIQKATELGVDTIIPIITDNCAVKLQTAQNKIAKWEKIAFESFKQCERANIPKITDVQNLSTIDYSAFDKIILCSEKEREKTLKSLSLKNSQKILVIIGVEGGFSQKEFDFFESKKFDIITLGNLILRAETAVISAISTLIYEREYGQQDKK